MWFALRVSGHVLLLLWWRAETHQEFSAPTGAHNEKLTFPAPIGAEHVSHSLCGIYRADRRG